MLLFRLFLLLSNELAAFLVSAHCGVSSEMDIVSYGWVTAVSNMLRFNFVFEVLGVWIFLGKMTTSYWLLWIGWVWMCKYCVRVRQGVGGFCGFVPARWLFCAG
jgi:hypothetical protein